MGAWRVTARRARRTAVRRVRGHSFLPGLLPSNPVVLDVGANHGAFTAVLATEFGARVTAVEPNPALTADVRNAGAAKVLNLALAGAGGTVRLSLDQNDECSTIVRPGGASDASVIEVEAAPLSDLLDVASPGRIDLLKIDVEGAEIAALEAADSGHLARVSQMTVEFHDTQGLTTPSAVRRVSRTLARDGFSPLRMSVRHRADVLFVRTGLLTRRELWWLRYVERPRQIASRWRTRPVTG